MRIGIIGDTHEPFCHPMYLTFCLDTFEMWGCHEVVHIGDVVDAHALSFWEHNPNGHSAESEAELAMQHVGQWHDAFPGIKVCVGNHDERQYRTARKAGIPDRYIKAYADVWQTPTWDWSFQHPIDDHGVRVLYEHGTGSGGKDAAYNRAVAQRCSLVMGHVHSYAGVKYHSNPFSRIFGLNVGCGIDLKSYAFEYGRAFPVRPMLGCGIVVDGVEGYFIPMPCGDGEPYHRSRASDVARDCVENLHEQRGKRTRNSTSRC